MNIHRPLPDVAVLADRLEVPGIGHLPVNAFVLHAAEPVVVDTGLGLPDRNFLEDLGTELEQPEPDPDPDPEADPGRAQEVGPDRA